VKRSSLNTFRDGFVEGIDSNTIAAIRNNQPATFQGTLIQVPVVEAGGLARVGRFGRKNQHASLQSFFGAAYLFPYAIYICHCRSHTVSTMTNGKCKMAY
jgi:hypothetical protein